MSTDQRRQGSQQTRPVSSQDARHDAREGAAPRFGAIGIPAVRAGLQARKQGSRGTVRRELPGVLRTRPESD